ncbi:MAG: NADH-quinone oxidoreductase subunit H [Pirellulaceae bacterium]|nr:NADH-quinone oxidoreductase subunit H [Pirellulaceae bacterium]
MVAFSGLIQILLALVLAPLLMSVIHRTKARFAGRRGQPWLQPYRELGKLLRKSAVYSRTTSPLFYAGPVFGGAAIVLALVFLPLAGAPALISFPGDFVFVAYLLGLARFCTVLAALDTGSSFEGMGASREVCFSALAEPALLLAFTAIAALTHQLSLSEMMDRLGHSVLLSAAAPALLLSAAALMIVFLAENARIPVDDPTTHLELTMIHEVMVLDHSGPDFALIQYAASLKLWILGSLLVGVLMPVRSGSLLVEFAAGVLGLVLLAVVTGCIESGMARLRLVRVPQFLIAASVLATLALVLVVR